MAKKPNAEDTLYADLQVAGFDPTREFEFCEHRAWRMDFAWPEIKLAIEVNGAGFGHQSISGQRRDMEKTNAAIEHGWRVLAYPAQSVTTHKRRVRIVEQIRRVICGVECPQSAAVVLTGD